MKKKYQALILGIVVIIFAGILLWHGKNTTKTERFEAQFTDVFDTVTNIIGYGESQETFPPLSCSRLYESMSPEAINTVYHCTDLCNRLQ